MKDFTYKKEFVCIIEKLALRHSCWQVWGDFLTMAAISMANAVLTAEREKREAEYLKACRRYSEQEVQELTNLFVLTVRALEENPEQDFLGELYHALHLEQNQKGQFFTPYVICRFMTEAVTDKENIQRKLERKGFISVSDPACGSGAMLAAFANMMKSNHINYQKHVLFVAQDIDYTAAMMCFIQLSLLGCSAVIIIGDTLTKPNLHPDNDIWYTPLYHLNRHLFQTTKEEMQDSGLKVSSDIHLVCEETEGGQYSLKPEQAS